MTFGTLTRWLRLGERHLLPPRDAYARWADTYPPRPHNPLMQIEQAMVAPIIAAAMPRCALDAGTGTGRYLPLLRAAGARTAIGIDLSLPMLRRHAPGSSRVCADAVRLPFRDHAFDLVCSSLMVGDVADLASWIREAARVLAPGGHLVYSDFHPSWSAGRWRRTFRAADGQLYELPYHAHAIDEHLARLEAVALPVRSIREPRLEGQSAPVVVVFHAVKHGLPAVPHRRRIA